MSRLVSILGLTLVAGAVGLTAPDAAAQPAPIEADDVRVDLTEPDEAPVRAGKQTRAAQAAVRLFERKLWAPAARGLHRVATGETGDHRATREQAEFRLGVALYRLKLPHAAYFVFSGIAGDRSHAMFKPTALWLARLAVRLPEPADVVERLGKYTDEQIADVLDTKARRRLFWSVSYLLGEYHYRNGRCTDALRALARVDSRSARYAEAQYLVAMCHLRLRRAAPSISALHRARRALRRTATEDQRALRDLVHLSLARLYYATSRRPSPSGRGVRVDRRRVDRALRHFRKVRLDGPYATDSLSERSSAYSLVGRDDMALGSLHSLGAFKESLHPEGELLRASIFAKRCDYDSAATVVARFSAKYPGLEARLTKLIERQRGNEHRSFLLAKKMRNDASGLPKPMRRLVKNALSNREMERHFEYVGSVEKELRRLRAAPKRFRSSAVGRLILDALLLAHDVAMRNAGDAAVRQLDDRLGSLREHLARARRLQRSAPLRRAKIGSVASEMYSVTPIGEGKVLAWKFTGEYWPDEIGTYRARLPAAWCRKRQ